MTMDDKLHRRNELIKTQKQLIDLFYTWFALVKANDLPGARNVKELANIVRKRVYELEEEIKKESKLITKYN